MIERHGGLWLDPEGVVVFERYDSDRDSISLICKRPDGGFQPWLYLKGLPSDLQCLPFWEPTNSNVVFGSQEEATAYLDSLAQLR